MEVGVHQSGHLGVRKKHVVLSGFTLVAICLPHQTVSCLQAGTVSYALLHVKQGLPREHVFSE